jgi:hypothetical protein
MKSALHAPESIQDAPQRWRIVNPAGGRGRPIVLHGVIAGLDRLKTALGGSDA